MKTEVTSILTQVGDLMSRVVGQPGGDETVDRLNEIRRTALAMLNRAEERPNELEAYRLEVVGQASRLATVVGLHSSIDMPDHMLLRIGAMADGVARGVSRYVMMRNEAAAARIRAAEGVH